MERRSEKTGRAPVALVALALLGAWGWASPRVVEAQQDRRFQLEARAGVLYSSPLAESGVRTGPDQGFSGLEEMEVGGGLGPFVGAGLLMDVGHLLWAEAQAAVSWGTVEGEGPAGTWDAGNLTSFHASGGLRVGLSRGLYVRGLLGFIVQSAPDVAVFQEGDDTGLLVGAAVGYQPLETFPLSFEVEAQRFDFGTTALRRAGAPDGSVRRFFLTAAWRLGIGEKE